MQLRAQNEIKAKGEFFCSRAHGVSHTRAKRREKVLLFGSRRTAGSSSHRPGPNGRAQGGTGLSHQVGQTPRTMKPRCLNGGRLFCGPLFLSLCPLCLCSHQVALPGSRGKGSEKRHSPEGPWLSFVPGHLQLDYISQQAQSGGWEDGGVAFLPFFLPHHILP